VRPRLVITGDESRKVSAFASTVSSAEAGVDPPTIGGMSQPVKARRSAAPVVLAGAVIALGAAFVGAGRWETRMAAPPRRAPEAMPAVVPIASAPSRTAARVQVLPPAATVDVDGAPAAVSDGAVTIEGALGSIHHVRLRDGAREASVDVALTEQGAMPPR